MFIIFGVGAILTAIPNLITAGKTKKFTAF